MFFICFGPCTCLQNFHDFPCVEVPTPCQSRLSPFDIVNDCLFVLLQLSRVFDSVFPSSTPSWSRDRLQRPCLGALTWHLFHMLERDLCTFAGVLWICASLLASLHIEWHCFPVICPLLAQGHSEDIWRPLDRQSDTVSGPGSRTCPSAILPFSMVLCRLRHGMSFERSVGHLGRALSFE